MGELIKLGDTVRDAVTGLVGVVTARCEYMYGITRVLVQPPLDKDGMMPDEVWFDVPRLVKVDA